MTEREQHLTNLINALQPRLDEARATAAAAETQVEGLMYDLNDEGVPVSPAALDEARAAVRKARALVLDLQQEMGGYRHRLQEVQDTLDIPWTR